MSFVLATALFVLGCIVLLASLDDVIIDILTFTKLKKPRIPELPADAGKLKGRRKPSIAIFVANWHEADVLGPMVERNLENFTYGPVKFVLGVYPNDTETLAVARKLALKYPRSVQVIVNRRNGPTSKGQMLNEMFAQLYAKPATAPDLAVLHDSEDVIAPQSFAIYARESQRHAMIQIPIFSIDSRHRSLVGATYMEEFAERHTRELLVREQMGAFVPSAGVGTCLRKDLIVHFISKRGHVLQPGCVTEDYVLGAEAHRDGFSTSFAAFKSAPHKPGGTGSIIATLEYFPKDFGASVRQRTRWTYGIGFEGAKRLGWFGSGWNRFFLYRDRKGAIANFLPCISLVLLIACLTIGPDFSEFSELQRNILLLVLGANSFNIVLRVVQKSLALRDVYGTYDLLGVIGRWPVAMVINAYAAGRAWRSYLVESARASKPIAWAKTQHELPSVFKFPSHATPIPVTAGARRVRLMPSRHVINSTLGGLTAAAGLALIVAGGLRIQSGSAPETLKGFGEQALIAEAFEIDQHELKIVAGVPLGERKVGTTVWFNVGSIDKSAVAARAALANIRKTATAMAEQSLTSAASEEQQITTLIIPPAIVPEGEVVASNEPVDEPEVPSDVVDMTPAEEANAHRTATALAEFSLIASIGRERDILARTMPATAGSTIEVAVNTDTPDQDQASDGDGPVLPVIDEANTQRTARALAEFSLLTIAQNDTAIQTEIALARQLSVIEVASQLDLPLQAPSSDDEDGPPETAAELEARRAGIEAEARDGERLAKSAIADSAAKDQAIAERASGLSVPGYQTAAGQEMSPPADSTPHSQAAIAEKARELATASIAEAAAAETLILNRNWTAAPSEDGSNGALAAKTTANAGGRTDFDARLENVLSQPPLRVTDDAEDDVADDDATAPPHHAFTGILNWPTKPITVEASQRSTSKKAPQLRKQGHEKGVLANKRGAKRFVRVKGKLGSKARITKRKQKSNAYALADTKAPKAFVLPFKVKAVPSGKTSNNPRRICRNNRCDD